MTAKSVETVVPACALRRLRALIRPRTGRTLVAIDGIDGAGKTTFADDLAELLDESGFTVIRICLDNYLNPPALRYAQGRFSAKGFFEDSYDYERFTAEVLEPLGADGSGRYRTAAYDLRAECEVRSPWKVAPDDAVVIVDGLFLHRLAWCPQVGRKLWDFSVWLSLPFDAALQRLIAQEGCSSDPEDPSNARHFRGQQLYLAQCAPDQRADLVVDSTAPRTCADD